MKIESLGHVVIKVRDLAVADGNALELYADGSDDWKNDPDSLFTPVRRLSL